MFQVNLREYEIYSKIIKNIDDRKNTLAFSVQEGEKTYIASGFNSFVVYITADYLAGQRTVNALRGLGKNFAFISHTDDVLLFKRSVQVETKISRFKLLAQLIDYKREKLDGVVMSIEAMAQLYPSIDEYRENIIELSQNQTISPRVIIKKLTECGYTRKPLVENVGDFSLRGDILDVYSHEGAYRMEFFGDLIESIKLFDVETQKSKTTIISMTLFPYCDIFFNQSQDALDAFKKEIKESSVDSNAKSRLNEIYGELSSSYDNGYLLPFCKNSFLTEYLPKDSIVIFDSIKETHDKLTRFYDEHYTRCGYLIERGEISQGAIKQLYERADIFRKINTYVQLGMMNMVAGSFFSASEIININSTPPMNYRYSIKSLVEDINIWRRRGYKFAIFCGDEADRQALSKSLSDNDIYLDENGDEPSVEGVLLAMEYEKGFVSPLNKLAVVGTNQLSIKTRANRGLRKTAKQVFFSPQVNDYVVHDIHGVGLCNGIVTLEVDGEKKDYIEVSYRKGDTLFVPVEASNLLSKYSGSDNSPRLSALGGGEFEKLKNRVKNTIRELAIDLVKLYASRQNARDRVYHKDNMLEEMFQEAFPYKLTADQERSVDEITADLDSNRIMDRLLCGDVGFGKTEVAMRAMFRVASNGYQVAFLAPTTILTEQHYETVCKRFSDFNLRVACLNRFRSIKHQKEIIKAIKNGEYDIIVGTHRMLSKDIEFKNLGLLVLDEEQRFGVEHKEILKDVRNTIDVLTLSATPIPRTLHMSLIGIRDISTITTPPVSRLPVDSYVIEDSPALIRDIIIREMKRGGQVFFVYNRVNTIDSFTNTIQALVPEARIVVGHGQMDNAVLEKNIYDFAKGHYDILICTTIIENGIDLPNANTIIIYDADNLGLSQLYQLRGRVGRGDRLAYAYFIYRENKVLSPDAYKRLNSIMENTELGSGFKLAMRDLEIRGAGNVLGKEQHGHIASVGFEMYTKLLKEVISETKGEITPEVIQTETDIGLSALIPNEYIDNAKGRMEAYQRLSDIKTAKDRDEFKEELRDIYGAVPKETLNLLSISYIKALANNVFISKVVINRRECKLVLSSLDAMKNPHLQKAYRAFISVIKINSKDGNVELDFDFGRKTLGYNVGAVQSFLEIANNIHSNQIDN